jgi:hypothetical protein
MNKELKDIIIFVSVSAVALGLVEATLVKTSGSLYTELYRGVRQHPNRLVATSPLIAAFVVLLHLERKIPISLDPFHQVGRLIGWAKSGEESSPDGRGISLGSLRRWQ